MLWPPPCSQPRLHGFGIGQSRHSVQAYGVKSSLDMSSYFLRIHGHAALPSRWQADACLHALLADPTF